MGSMDHQLGVIDEVAYGTPLTVTRFFEYESEQIDDDYGRTEGNPLRVGSSVIRSDRATPYYKGAAGSVSMAVLSKGFGFWNKHLLGVNTTAAPAETVAYAHTGTEGALYGKSFSAQVNRPFHPSGTNQAFSFEGGKVTEFTLSNAVDGNLMLDMNWDFEQVATATALATASYPTAMENLTWAGGVVSIGGVAAELNEFSFTFNNGYDTERRKIRNGTDKKEPTSGRREGTFSLSCDFDSLTNRALAASNTQAGALAQIIGTWKAPTLLGTTIYPQLVLTLPAARFDAWKGATSGPDAIKQELSGVVRYTGSGSPVTLAYTSADVTA